VLEGIVAGRGLAPLREDLRDRLPDIVGRGRVLVGPRNRPLDCRLAVRVGVGMRASLAGARIVADPLVLGGVVTERTQAAVEILRLDEVEEPAPGCGNGGIVEGRPEDAVGQTAPVAAGRQCGEIAPVDRIVVGASGGRPGEQGRAVRPAARIERLDLRRLPVIGVVGLTVASVARAVTVAVGLGGVAHARADVAEVPMAVSVRVELPGVEGRWAVIHVTADPVAVGVVQGGEGARITRVAGPVGVRVELVRVVSVGAVVPAGRDAVAVGVARVAAHHAGTGVTGIANSIAVGVRLVGVGSVRTVVAGVAHEIAVPIGLVGVGRPGAVVVAAGRLASGAAVIGVLPVAIAVVEDA